MKRTYQPSNFVVRANMVSVTVWQLKNGRRVLAARRRKGRKVLAA